MFVTFANMLLTIRKYFSVNLILARTFRDPRTFVTNTNLSPLCSLFVLFSRDTSILLRVLASSDKAFSSDTLMQRHVSPRVISRRINGSLFRVRLGRNVPRRRARTPGNRVAARFAVWDGYGTKDNISGKVLIYSVAVSISLRHRTSRGEKSQGRISRFRSRDIRPSDLIKNHHIFPALAIPPADKGLREIVD